jgi:hypothetical protein
VAVAGTDVRDRAGIALFHAGDGGLLPAGRVRFLTLHELTWRRTGITRTVRVR